MQEEKTELRRLVEQLMATKEGARISSAEAGEEEEEACSSVGSWDLIMSDTQLFRSSPFFMAARSLLQDGEQADKVACPSLRLCLVSACLSACLSPCVCLCV